MSRLLVALWILALGAVFYVTSGRTHEAARRRYSLVESPPLAELDDRVLSMVTLGHRGLYDDFINIWALQMLMDEKVRQQDPLLLHQRLMQIARHEPKIESYYMVSCFVLAMDFGRPELCEPLIRHGLKAFPYNWRIPVTQGFMFAYKLNDPKNAAIYYGLAASRPDAPEYLEGLSRKLAEQAELNPEELRTTLDSILAIPGSRMGDYLREQQ